MELKARAGIVPGCAPVGYKNVAGGVVLDAQTAPLIVEAFHLAAGKMSLEKILTELTPKGLCSRNYKPMGRSALRLILNNPFYIGKLRFKGELLEGKHEPLIKENLYATVQSALKSRGRKRNDDIKQAALY